MFSCTRGDLCLVDATHPEQHVRIQVQLCSSLACLFFSKAAAAAAACRPAVTSYRIQRATAVCCCRVRHVPWGQVLFDMFPDMPQQTLTSILQSCGGNVSAAVDEALTLASLGNGSELGGLDCCHVS